VSDRGRRLVAWGLLGVALACLVTLVVLAATTSFDPAFHETPDLAVFVVFALVGAVVAAGAPRNSIGWLLLVIGVCGGALGVSSALVEIEIASPGSVPAASGIAWLSMSLGFVVLLTIPALLQRFPSGLLPSPRWRWANAVTAAAFLSWSAVSFAPGPLDEHPEFENPLGIPGFNEVSSALEPISVVLFVTMLLVALSSIVVRFRRADGVERLQIKWVASAIALTIALWLAAFVSSYDDSDSLMWTLWIFSLCTVPLSIGVAVRRYRLYELDRVISRTVVYALLTVVLGIVYAGLVLAGQWVFASFAGGSNLAIAVSTLVVAALFLPVRSRVQRFVDRRFYRRRYDAQRTLEVFGARLREQVDLDTLASDLRGVVQETMQPTHASLWLREGTR
jgi:hypothetical protein